MADKENVFDKLEYSQKHGNRSPEPMIIPSIWDYLSGQRFTGHRSLAAV